MNKRLSASSAAAKGTQLQFPSRLRKWAIMLGFCLLPVAASASPAPAAERIYVTYTILERSIAIDALEVYAREGKINDDLAAYSGYVNAEQMAKLREILLTRARVSPVAISQFLYTPQGEYLLQRLGRVIQTESRQPGDRSIRAALILAAADSNGLTLLNVMRKFPTAGIRVDLTRSLQMVDELSKIVNQTNQAIAAVVQKSTTDAADQSPNSATFGLNLQQPGIFTWRKEMLKLSDRSRERNFEADIYLPVSSGVEQLPKLAPVIIISHGLGEDRNTFTYLAQHLASYGFAVAVPEHPGSNAQQLQNLFRGRANQAVEPKEFINRPLDVKYLLDELERLSQSEPVYQGLNLQQVGVIGQSFGGYTALVLAGSNLNFERLQKSCRSIDVSWNLSLLLQCEALKLMSLGTELMDSTKSLQDERVKAAFAINPIISSVLGADELSQLKVPVAIVASSADTVTPALEEQIQPFTWLTTPDKYLVVIENATHFSTLGEEELSNGAVPLPSQLIGPEPELARGYMKALGLAFFQTHLEARSEYRPFLSAAYAKAIGQPPLNLSLVQSLVGVNLTSMLQIRQQNVSASTSQTKSASITPFIP